MQKGEKVRRWLFPGLLLVTTGLLTGCGRSAGEALRQAGPPAVGEIAFEDVQPGSGLDFRLGHAPGQALGIKETIGHPAALLDADGDGRLDVLLAGPNRVSLFRNLGDCRFQQVPDPRFRQAG